MTQFSVVRCDNRDCAKQEEGKPHGGKGPRLADWFTITQALLTAKLLPSEHNFVTWHVCSLECMAAYARQELAYCSESRAETIASNLKFNQELQGRADCEALLVTYTENEDGSVTAQSIEYPNASCQGRTREEALVNVLGLICDLVKLQSSSTSWQAT